MSAPMDGDSTMRGIEPGAARRRRSQGRMHQKTQDRMTEIDGSLAGWTDEFVFGEVWAGEDLAWTERVLVAVIALATQGHHVQMKNYLHGALQAGIPEAKLREALKMLVVYAGFPVAIQALDVLGQVAAIEARHSSA
jgi:4-carboxymuconolactone decarboxylase